MHHRSEENLTRLQQTLTTRTRRVRGPGERVPAAVLVPLYETPDGLGTLFTQRTLSLEHHAGEVSFPGGRFDPSDADTVETALREAHEEIGLDPAHVEVLGLMDDSPTVTNFLITPVVGRIPHPYGYTPNGAEVERIIEARLSELRAPGVHHVDPWERDGRTYMVHSYDLAEATVWGATARLVHELLELFG